MKTEFKDVAHLYLGCMVELDNSGSKVIKTMVAVGGYEDEHYCKLRLGKPGGFVHVTLFNHETIKPILRRLEDMTNEENSEYSKINTPSSMLKYKWIGDYASKTAYLLSKHFDIFGLIDSGQAIDVKTIKTNPSI